MPLLQLKASGQFGHERPSAISVRLHRSHQAGPRSSWHANVPAISVRQDSRLIPKAFSPEALFWAAECLGKEQLSSCRGENSLVEWNDPMVIVGGAQIFMSLVLALFTLFLWRSTDKYAQLTERDLMIKEKNRQIGCLTKEMDNLIGLLYCRTSDPDIFNLSLAVEYSDPDGRGGMSPSKEMAVFWRIIKKNQYLVPSSADLEQRLKDYMEYKWGEVGVGKDGYIVDDEAYKKTERELIDAIKRRYDNIKTDLSTIESDIKFLMDPKHPLV